MCKENIHIKIKQSMMNRYDKMNRTEKDFKVGGSERKEKRTGRCRE